MDTLITVGIANSRAEVLRWAMGRIPGNPAYAQLQERVHEIDETGDKSARGAERGDPLKILLIQGREFGTCMTDGYPGHG